MEIIRLVGVIRQSKFKGDQAISEESQRQAQESFVAARNRTLEPQGKRLVIVGWAIDLGFSADKYDPWKRPALSAWLKKPEAWDGMISFKLDRIARNTLDFAKLMQYWDEHDKTFMCTDDPIDLTTDLGRAVAVILSVLAELELKNIKTRNKNARKTLNEAGRWTGGRIPYGRKPVPVNGILKLVKDPTTAEVFQRILELFYDGLAYGAIAEVLNKDGVPTPQAHQEKKPREKLRQWEGSVISDLLRSRHLIGQREINGMVLRDENGEPIEYCEPLMTVSEWNRLQRKLDERTNGTKGVQRRNATLGYRVGGCMDCGSTIQGTAGRPKAGAKIYRRYRCSTVGAKANGRTDVKSCDNSSIKMEVWDSHLENSILDAVGHLPRMERVYLPGEDHTEELEQVDDAITSLQKERDLGLVRSEEEYFSRLMALMERRAKLHQLPRRPAGWQYTPTGETVAEYWNSMDTPQRNAWLQEMGVRLYYSHKGDTYKWGLILGDLDKLRLIAQGALEM